MVVKRVWKRPPNRSHWLSMLKAIGTGASGAVALKSYLSRKRRQARRNTTGVVKRVTRRRTVRPRRLPNPRAAMLNKRPKRVMNDWGSTNHTKGGPNMNVVMYRALKSQLDKTIFYYRGINTFGTSSGGFYKMNFGPAAEIQTGTWTSIGVQQSLLPYYVLSLNGGPQTDNFTPRSMQRLSTYTAASVGNYEDAGLAFMQNSMLTTAGGTLGASYLLETSASQGSTVASNGLGQKALLLWQQVKLNLYGSKTRPIRYHIRIVQFKDKETYDPFLLTTDPANIAQINAEAQQFYQEELKQLTYNPIDKVNVYNSKRAYRVIHSEVITIDPPKTIDQDQVPNVHTWKYFVRPGSLCDFSKVASNSVDPAKPVVDDVNYRNAIRSDIARVNNPYPHNHTVMIITATDFGGSEARSVFTSDLHGSFDAYVRSCWTGNRYA